MEDGLGDGAVLALEDEAAGSETGDVTVGTADVKLLDDGNWTLVSVTPVDDGDGDDPPVIVLPVIGIGVVMVVD